MMLGLGEAVVQVVTDANLCPPGTRARRVYSSSAEAAAWNYTPQYWECVQGEPWYCEWFGWGCQGPVPVEPPAPETGEQMTEPGAWTPEDVAAGWMDRYRKSVQGHLEHTSGTASAFAWMSQKGEEITDAVKSPALWFAVGAVAVIAAIVAAKRV